MAFMDTWVDKKMTIQKSPQDHRPYPYGWFVIAFSNELEPGQIIPITYFGRDLILFRTQSGDACVLDAYCPHLGAHLGYNGEVVSDTVRCPFHHWQFDTSGTCVDIPYCKGKIPAKAKIKSWTVEEKNQMIYLWFHPEDEPPQFDIPLLPMDESHDESATWTPWAHHMLEIDTHSKEILENVVDIGHFIPVHGTHIDTFDNVFEGHQAVQISKGTAYPRGGGKDHFSLTATYYGPGFQITHMDGYLKSMLVNAHTLIHENRVRLRFGVSILAPAGMDNLDEISTMYVQNLTTGFLEDVQIWENKTYRQHPMLCDGDGPIMKLRKWYQQYFL